jgi:hypothetical protein
VTDYHAQTARPRHAPGASPFDLAKEPKALEQILDAIDRRLAASPDTPLLAERRATLLRALGRLDEACSAYASLASDQSASRVYRILSERPVEWTDRVGPVPFVRVENFLTSAEQARLWSVVADPDASFFAGSVKGTRASPTTSTCAKPKSCGAQTRFVNGSCPGHWP